MEKTKMLLKQSVGGKKVERGCPDLKIYSREPYRGLLQVLQCGCAVFLHHPFPVWFIGTPLKMPLLIVGSCNAALWYDSLEA